MSAPLIPEVLWAQRSNKTEAAKNFIYLTITVPDVKPENLKIDIKEQSLSFDAYSESLKRAYHVVLDFYAEIDPKESKTNATGKTIEFVLRKKEPKEEFWPRLLKEAKKVHFLKTDFDKWVDEDEQDEAPEDDLGAMGGMGGMPGMGDMGGMMGGAGGDFGGIDFSKLGGANMGGEGGEDEDEDEDEDDDMPALEGDDEEEEEEEATPAAGKKTSKIEEIN